MIIPLHARNYTQRFHEQINYLFDDLHHQRVAPRAIYQLERLSSFALVQTGGVPRDAKARRARNTKPDRTKEGRKEMFYLTTHSTHFILRLHGVGHMVKDHSDSETKEGRKCFI